MLSGLQGDCFSAGFVGVSIPFREFKCCRLKGDFPKNFFHRAFQSLSGNSSVVGGIPENSGRQTCRFNPFQGIQVLSATAFPVAHIAPMGFQSLSGNSSVVGPHWSACRTEGSLWFQSLSGNSSVVGEDGLS